MFPCDKWTEFEERKRALQQAGLSPAEYDTAIKRLLKELGL